MSYTPETVRRGHRRDPRTMNDRIETIGVVVILVVVGVLALFADNGWALLPWLFGTAGGG